LLSGKAHIAKTCKEGGKLLCSLTRKQKNWVDEGTILKIKTKNDSTYFKSKAVKIKVKTFCGDWCYYIPAFPGL